MNDGFVTADFAIASICERPPSCVERHGPHVATRGERLVLVRDTFPEPRPRPGIRAETAHHHRRSTPTTGSRRHPHCSTPTTSTPPSTSSTPDTLPAKLPPTRIRGRSSHDLRRLNRHELARDDTGLGEHRSPTSIAFAPGEMTAYIHATWNVAPDLRIYIESVHRLSSLGVVVTPVAHSTSQQGFDAEWRVIYISDGRRLSDQPRRAIRRGRPRRRACALRRAQSTAAARKRLSPDLWASRRCIQPPRFGWFSRSCWCGRSIRR